MTSRPSTSKIVFVIASTIALPLFAGCGDDHDDAYNGAYYGYDYYGYDDYYMTGVESGLTYAYTDPLYDPYYYYDVGATSAVSESKQTNDPAGAATAVAASSTKYFTPAGCAKVERDGAKLTYTFSDCTGPLGTRKINGHVVVTFARDGGGGDEDGGADLGDGGTSDAAVDHTKSLVIEITSKDLRAEDANVVLDMRSVYRVDANGNKTVTSQTNNRISRNGKSIMTMAMSTLTWDKAAMCVGLESNSTLTVDHRSIETTLDGYERCIGKCPSAGTLRMSEDSQMSTLTFDGTSQAKLKTSGKKDTTVNLNCDDGK